MSPLFRRHRATGPPDPERAFEEAVRGAAARLSAGVVSYDPAGEVQLSGMHLAGTVDLRNVKALCAASPPDRWEEIVGEHLAGLASALLSRRGLADLRRVQPLLRSRLYDEGALLLADVAARPLAPGIVEALVVAEGGAIATVPRPVAEGWDVPLDLLYPPARAAVRREGRLPTRQVDVGGPVLTAVESGSFFTTTHLFWLDSYLDLPADGAVVAVPNRHLVLAHPLRDATAVDAVHAMIVNTTQFYEQGPGGVSPHVYWWRSGALHLLPALVDAARVSFHPPPEFAAVLRRLPPGR